MPDMDVMSSDMASHYGIRFYRGLSGGFVMALWGNEFYMIPADLPLDLQKQSQDDEPLKVLTETNVLDCEVDPMIV